MSARLLLVLGGVAVLLLGLTPAAASASPAAVNGSGSSYVGLAMQQWVADAQTNGLKVNYSPTGSPQGLTSFAQNLTDFAGTEAEFTALNNTNPARGYQYVPDVAGAVAMMYNVSDKAGKKVDYLHLARRTVARIFTGDIINWNDAAITADNKGLQLPDHPINVVYRGGQSGTTGLFYDFVANVAPDIFGPWAAKHQFPTTTRIIQLDSSADFVPKSQAFNGSDQIAQFIAGGAGQWSIGYDEFGYAKTYNVPAAWIQNGHGDYVQPYAPNISAALEGAKLRPDLSQELSGVYNSNDPLAYPISAYSYIVTQCAASADRPTCKGAYGNAGVTETLSAWLRYIACDGQVNMASIGYSPLPKNLSQEMANSIARMQGNGVQPEQLTAGNCANPRFSGQLGGGAAPPDPLKNVKDTSGGNGSGAANGNGAGGAGTAADGVTTTTVAIDSAAGQPGAVKAAGGGSGKFQVASPVLYDRPASSGTNLLPVMLLIVILAVPALVLGGRRRRRSSDF